MEDIIERDLRLTQKVLNRDYEVDWCKLYFSTNEYLDEILSNFDLEDKRVLTVLGSGDQAFHLYNRGAKRVDVFDINKLTIYYYYLRRWTVIYLGQSYPDYIFDNDYLKRLLSLVRPNNQDEQNAYDYWTEFVSRFDGYDYKNLFNQQILDINEQIYENTNLSKILENDDFSFFNVDMARKVHIPGKYDVVYTSNIADYVNLTGSFNRYRLNLKKLLKKDGIIISSSISGFSYVDGREDLEKSFIYHQLPKIYQPHVDKSSSSGYYYTKKKLTDYMEELL